MLNIRLSRIGKKNKPMYRLVIMEKSKDPYGRALEILGSYNPYNKELQAKAERINHWLNHGATMSPTVNNLLIEKEIIKGEKVKASRPRAKRKGEEKKEAPAAAATKEENKEQPAAPTEETPVKEEKSSAPTEKEVPEAKAEAEPVKDPEEK